MSSWKEKFLKSYAWFAYGITILFGIQLAIVFPSFAEKSRSLVTFLGGLAVMCFMTIMFLGMIRLLSFFHNFRTRIILPAFAALTTYIMTSFGIFVGGLLT